MRDNFTINMPAVNPRTTIEVEEGKLYLAQDKNQNVATVTFAGDTVLYFESNGAIEYSDKTFFNCNYVILRKYESGETLSITVD